MNQVFLFVLTLATAACHAQLTIVTLDDKKNPNEPSFAIQPNNGDLVAASNVDNLYTIDYQRIKSHINKHKAKSNLGVYGDPVLHYSDSILYFAHLSKTPKKEWGDWFDRIVVQKLVNVNSWQEKSFSVGYNNNKMQDKPWLSSDNVSTKHIGNVYVTWTEFDKYNSDASSDYSRIRFSRLETHADSFSAAITISDSTGDCRDGDNTLEGATTTIDANGNIYAAWAGHEKLWFDISTDGGKTWGNDKIIGTQPSGWKMDMPNIMRANGMPFLKCDTKNDILYICWADEHNGNADVWLKYSKDKGNTWSERILINKDSSNSHQYFPNMTIDQKTGTVFIAFYDFRYSQSNSFYHIFLNTFTPQEGVSEHQITQESIPLPGTALFYGDYLDIDVQNKQLGVVYTAYDITQKSKVMLAYTPDYTKNLVSNYTTESTFAIRQNDNIKDFVVNEMDDYSITAKVVMVDLSHKRRKIKIKHSETISTVYQDKVIAVLSQDQNEKIEKLKIKIKNPTTGYKRKVLQNYTY